MPLRKFDLNIERVLEHWTVAHALREIIANAIDEQALTSTQEPEIFRDDEGRWHVRDWGRGLRYEHLTQNENKEKLANPNRVIGKFGVGLKDAFATFDRKRIGVEIRSRHGDISIGKDRKHGFEDLSTLHALINDPINSSMNGTDVVLSGITDQDVETAKSFFLRYSDDELLERTAMGEVLRRPKATAHIYVNGLRVAEERNFLFSYNVTSPTKPMLRALNRERSNVGRTAYTDRVKVILLACRSAIVADALAEDLQRFQSGLSHDELQWLDVAVHACQVLNAAERVMFVIASELSDYPSVIDRARGDGIRIIVVSDSVRTRLPRLLDLTDQPIRDLKQYVEEWNQSFQYMFVTSDDLTEAERLVWERTKDIFRLAGGRPRQVREIRISETMRPSGELFREAIGVWDAGAGMIVIKRSQLASLVSYSGTLLHEVVHARTMAADLSPEFEDGLTTMLGEVASRQLQQAARA